MARRVLLNVRGQIAGSYQLPSSFCAGFLRQRDGPIITFNVQPQLGPVIRANSSLGIEGALCTQGAQSKL